MSSSTNSWHHAFKGASPSPLHCPVQTVDQCTLQLSGIKRYRTFPGAYSQLWLSNSWRDPFKWLAVALFANLIEKKYILNS